jgi:hypothetical protein
MVRQEAERSEARFRTPELIDNTNKYFTLFLNLNAF